MPTKPYIPLFLATWGSEKNHNTELLAALIYHLCWQPPGNMNVAKSDLKATEFYQNHSDPLERAASERSAQRLGSSKGNQQKPEAAFVHLSTEYTGEGGRDWAISMINIPPRLQQDDKGREEMLPVLEATPAAMQGLNIHQYAATCDGIFLVFSHTYGASTLKNYVEQLGKYITEYNRRPKHRAPSIAYILLRNDNITPLETPYKRMKTMLRSQNTDEVQLFSPFEHLDYPNERNVFEVNLNTIFTTTVPKRLAKTSEAVHTIQSPFLYLFEAMAKRAIAERREDVYININEDIFNPTVPPTGKMLLPPMSPNISHSGQSSSPVRSQDSATDQTEYEENSFRETIPTRPGYKREQEANPIAATDDAETERETEVQALSSERVETDNVANYLASTEPPVQPDDAVVHPRFPLPLSPVFTKQNRRDLPMGRDEHGASLTHDAPKTGYPRSAEFAQFVWGKARLHEDEDSGFQLVAYTNTKQYPVIWMQKVVSNIQLIKITDTRIVNDERDGYGRGICYYARRGSACFLLIDVQLSEYLDSKNRDIVMQRYLIIESKEAETVAGYMWYLLDIVHFDQLRIDGLRKGDYPPYRTRHIIPTRYQILDQAEKALGQAIRAYGKELILSALFVLLDGGRLAFDGETTQEQEHARQFILAILTLIPSPFRKLIAVAQGVVDPEMAGSFDIIIAPSLWLSGRRFRNLYWLRLSNRRFVPTTPQFKTPDSLYRDLIDEMLASIEHGGGMRVGRLCDLINKIRNLSEEDEQRFLRRRAGNETGASSDAVQSQQLLAEQFMNILIQDHVELNPSTQERGRHLLTENNKLAQAHLLPEDELYPIWATLIDKASREKLYMQRLAVAAQNIHYPVEFVPDLIGAIGEDEKWNGLYANGFPESIFNSPLWSDADLHEQVFRRVRGKYGANLFRGCERALNLFNDPDEAAKRIVLVYEAFSTSLSTDQGKQLIQQILNDLLGYYRSDTINIENEWDTFAARLKKWNPALHKPFESFRTALYEQSTKNQISATLDILRLLNVPSNKWDGIFWGLFPTAHLEAEAETSFELGSYLYNLKRNNGLVRMIPSLEKLNLPESILSNIADSPEGQLSPEGLKVRAELQDLVARGSIPAMATLDILQRLPQLLSNVKIAPSERGLLFPDDWKRDMIDIYELSLDFDKLCETARTSRFVEAAEALRHIIDAWQRQSEAKTLDGRKLEQFATKALDALLPAPINRENIEYEDAKQLLVFYLLVSIMRRQDSPIDRRTDTLPDVKGTLELTEVYRYLTSHHNSKLGVMQQLWDASISPIQRLGIAKKLIEKLPTNDFMMRFVCYDCAAPGITISDFEAGRDRKEDQRAVEQLFPLILPDIAGESFNKDMGWQYLVENSRLEAHLCSLNHERKGAILVGFSQLQSVSERQKWLKKYIFPEGVRVLTSGRIRVLDCAIGMLHADDEDGAKRLLKRWFEMLHQLIWSMIEGGAKSDYTPLRWRDELLSKSYTVQWIKAFQSDIHKALYELLSGNLEEIDQNLENVFDWMEKTEISGKRAITREDSRLWLFDLASVFIFEQEQNPVEAGLEALTKLLRFADNIGRSKSLRTEAAPILCHYINNLKNAEIRYMLRVFESIWYQVDGQAQTAISDLQAETVEITSRMEETIAQWNQLAAPPNAD